MNTNITDLTDFKEKLPLYIQDGYFFVDTVSRFDRELIYYTKLNNTETFVPAQPTDNFYIGTNYDANIQHVIIKIPYQYEGRNLSEANKVYIYYKHYSNSVVSRITMNLNNCYVITEEDTSYIYIDWVIGSEVTQNHGDLEFSICLQKDSEIEISGQPVSYIDWEFHSQPADAVIVNTLHGTNTMSAIYYDKYEVDGWKNGYYLTTKLNRDEILSNIVANTEDTIIIDTKTRKLNIPENLLLGIEGDHYSKRIYFELPVQYQDNIFNIDEWDFYVQYTNAQGQTDYSPLEAVQPTNSSKLYLSWLVPIGATIKSGDVEISFSAVIRSVGEIDACPHDDNKIKKSFNTEKEELEVLSTVFKGERFANQIIESQNFTKRQFSKMMQTFFTENNIIINGDVW